MFIDDVRLTLVAGNGGNGVVAFRREKYVPLGGPAGGNGGKGGSIIFVGDDGLTTLIDLRYQKRISAPHGENGAAKNQFGSDAKDVYIRVPVGTVVHDLKDHVVIADITKHGQEVVICHGGKGGRGNYAFKTSRVTAPEICEKGERGEEREVQIELKVLADVGLVGFPNVGKSTLISVISAARPKIADYPFTTLAPNLGMVRVPDGRSFVVADLPGLIEGASMGAGLGFQFLRHIERTRVIVHVLDMGALERDPYEDFIKINHELETYNPRLLLRPQIIVANKMDLPGTEERLALLKKKIEKVDIIPLSAYTKSNLDELLYAIADCLDTVSLDEFQETIQEEVVEYRYHPEEPPFIITRDDDGVYHVTGRMIQKFFDLTDFSKDENVKLFARRIRNLGVDARLRELGVKHGDTVRILSYEFEFFD
ncbi:MAG: GTPase ObgE [Bacilli bacterium]|nr:GTPase ObgE [Bacilli bacterium]